MSENDRSILDRVLDVAELLCGFGPKNPTANLKPEDALKPPADPKEKK